MPLTPFPHGISSFGVPIYGGGFPQGIPSGSVYFVDGNSGSDSQKYAGESFDKPFKTLAATIAASHADIARGSDRWARRNTIFAAGDAFEESLTAFPQKTDIIGVGAYNNKSMPGLIGTHAITTASQGGCRWFNFEFLDDGVTANFTFTGGGYEFHNCVFRCDAGSQHAITGTAPSDVKIFGCDFLPDVDGTLYVTSAIEFTTAGYNCQIRGNTIFAPIGIAITDSGTYTHGVIDGNLIHASAVTIDDNSSDFVVTNNILISDAVPTVTGSFGELVDINVLLAARNHLVGTTINTVYPVLDTAT